MFQKNPTRVVAVDQEWNYQSSFVAERRRSERVARSRIFGHMSPANPSSGIIKNDSTTNQQERIPTDSTTILPVG